MAAPFESSMIERYPDRAAWDLEAAELTARMLERWRLRPVEAFTGGEAGATLLVLQDDDTEAVLKVGYPHLEGIHEAVALEAMTPMTPRILQQDAWTWAMLLERVSPGITLARAALPPDDAVAVGALRYADLAGVVPPAGIQPLTDYVAQVGAIAREPLPAWRAELDRFDALDPLERALDALHELAAGTVERRLLHGDYNPGNLLDAGDGSWRIIDPHPLVGDPAYDPWPLIEQLGDPWRQADPGALLARSASIVAERTGLEPRRILCWGLARTGLDLTWHLGDGALREAAETAAKLAVIDAVL